MFQSNCLIIIFLISLLNFVSPTEVSVPRVKTNFGDIKGHYKTSAEGKLYEAYEGIPYAQPPIGKLRFEPPEQMKPWVGELSATKPGPPCLQYTHMPLDPLEKVEGAEDCLYINIYVPTREMNDDDVSMPVFFWIHGGAFQYGSGNSGGKYLIDRGVIFVTVNYRLGPLGFLSTEDDIVLGNMGLKDQSMALRWVSENIQYFHGNPKQVTLGGLSAGGASVHYHYLSPLSAGLFRGGMSFSGTSLLCWTQTENALQKAKILGTLMGCPTNNNKDMIECLKSRPSRALVQAVSHFMPWLYNPYTPFGPVAEKFGDAPFINRLPIEIIRSGNVQDIPWITGVVSEEGLYPSAEFVIVRERMRELDEKWLSIAPHLLDYNFTISDEKHDEISNMIRTHYLNGKPIDRENEHPLTKMIGDRLFVVDSEKAAREQAKVTKNPVWYFYFTYKGAHSWSKALGDKDENLGVSHGDDTSYVLHELLVDTSTTQEDRQMQREMLDFWVSFIKNGTPSVGIDWAKLDPLREDLNYLRIAGPGKWIMESDNNFGQKQFWQTINFNENK